MCKKNPENLKEVFSRSRRNATDLGLAEIHLRVHGHEAFEGCPFLHLVAGGFARSPLPLVELRAR